MRAAEGMDNQIVVREKRSLRLPVLFEADHTKRFERRQLLVDILLSRSTKSAVSYLLDGAFSLMAFSSVYVCWLNISASSFSLGNVIVVGCSIYSQRLSYRIALSPSS